MDCLLLRLKSAATDKCMSIKLIAATGTVTITTFRLCEFYLHLHPRTTRGCTVLGLNQPILRDGFMKADDSRDSLELRPSHD